jgi:hypothetical protein
VRSAAAAGVRTPAAPLPFLDRIQASFGQHPLGHVKAHVGAEAASASRAMSARAFASGDHVVFGRRPDLRTTAHEAAHVVQQQAGARLTGGIGREGDAYERHADAVAEAVVAGRSAAGLLEPFAPARRPSAGAPLVQRMGNEPAPEDAAIAAIHALAPTPADKLAALEQSDAPELRYGLDARTDEETEVTASASYLNEKKRNWRAELLQRQGGHAPQWQSWESFQYEMGLATPGEPAQQPPWFMQANIGYGLHDPGNQADMGQIAHARENPAADDPQQLLGMTYMRDTMYTLASAAIENHKGAFGQATTAAATQGWNGDVLRITAGGELRLRITHVAGVGTDVTITGTVLPSPYGNMGVAAGAVVTIFKNGGTGTLQYNTGAMDVELDHWQGALESYAYHQSRTRINEALGMHLPEAGAPEARNRGVNGNLDDATFALIGQRYNSAGDPERGYQRTLGPHRTRLNFHDDPNAPQQVGWDVSVAAYRRLGGDSIFNEAPHPHPAAYQNRLQPAAHVDVSNPAWYYNQANAMPGRFVGGRSNSTALYMSSATMLWYRGRLSAADVLDVLAFVIADMVVSGEHSMPECMTTVVMAAGSSEPWRNTPLNLAAAADTLSVWLRLVADPVQHAMEGEARASLLRLLANPHPDPKLVKVLTILLKAL